MYVSHCTLKSTLLIQILNQKANLDLISLSKFQIKTANKILPVPIWCVYKELLPSLPPTP